MVSNHAYMDVAGEYLEFPKGTEIKFHDNGVVASGILVLDTLLRPIVWKIMDKEEQAHHLKHTFDLQNIRW